MSPAGKGDFGAHGEHSSDALRTGGTGRTAFWPRPFKLEGGLSPCLGIWGSYGSFRSARLLNFLKSTRSFVRSATNLILPRSEKSVFLLTPETFHWEVSSESQGRFSGVCTGTLDSASREFRMSPYSALSFFFAVFESFMIISFGVLDPM
jgi:hypothetical protein